ncbi:putative signal transducing protein [Frigidibacter sp. MR17.24]|uniref:putative signal transducing protein n=1 Tax=Frigidibacter sp. MR17.24 TaxID=3127345 RepID=UPI003012E693
MKEVLRTTDPTKIAYALVMLQGEDIDVFQMDVHMSILEGSVGLLPRRLMVADRDADRALRVLRDLGIADDGWHAGEA